MTEADRRSPDRHRRQEAEANAFAIELLAPRDRLRRYMKGEPHLDRVLAISEDFDISREAALRALCQPARGAVCRRVQQGRQVPLQRLAERVPMAGSKEGEEVPLQKPPIHAKVAPWETGAEEDWLPGGAAVELRAQTLHQADGYATTLLWVRSSPDDEDEAVEDAYDRFSRFGSR